MNEFEVMADQLRVCLFFCQLINSDHISAHTNDAGNRLSQWIDGSRR